MLLTPLAQLSIDLESTARTEGLQGYESTTADVAMSDFISNFLTLVIALAALAVFFLLIWAAIEWIGSGGDKGKLEKARNRMITAVTGLLVLASTVAIFMMVQKFLDITVLNFVRI